MKKLATIYSTFFSKEQTIALKLQEQPYVILIPKSILAKYGIIDEILDFHLVIQENKITLLGPDIPHPRVIRQPTKEAVM